MIKSLAGSNSKSFNIKNNKRKLEGIGRIPERQTQPAKRIMKYKINPFNEQGTQGNIIDLDSYYEYAVNELYV